MWAALFIWRRDFLKPLNKGLRLSAIAFAIVLVPLGIYGVRHPGDIGARAGGTSFLNKGLNGGHPIQTSGH